MTPGTLSMRDPAGACLEIGDRLLRVVRQEGRANAEAYLNSAALRRWQEEGRAVRTRVVPRGEWPALDQLPGMEAVLEHERIEFPSYPVEWTPGMLSVAGHLTLALARELLAEGRGLKDATPLNVLFRGSQPVFIDALSVEPRAPTDPIWLPYGQFVRTFVLPLLAARQLGWSLRRAFTGARDGLSPEELFPLLPWHGRLRRPALGMVTAPVLMSKVWAGGAVSRGAAPSTDGDRASYVLRRLLTHLDRAQAHAMPPARKSAWLSYQDPDVHPAEYHAVRLALVERVLRARRSRRVLDVGTNDGAFALLAASLGASVVAIDRDEASVERAFQRATAARASVLPLVVDLADPTPASGWANEERAAFLARAAGHFDAILCLAVLHHLVVAERLSLGPVVDLLASLTQDLLIAEFVPPEDPWCRLLARGRPLPPEYWSAAAFEAAFARRFRVEDRQEVGTRGRAVYVMRRQVGGADRP